MEAVTGEGVYIGFGKRAAGLVILDAVSKDLILVLIFRDVPVNPIFSLQIVLVLILAQVDQS